MKLQMRSYSTKMMRPKPVIHEEDDGSLIVIATSWGQPEHAHRVAEEVSKYVGAAKSDVEVTSPFEFLTSLSDETNYLKIAIQIANEQLYRGENKLEYFSGVEVLALFYRGSQLAWAHVGQPNILIQRKKIPLQPLSMGLDLSSEIVAGSATMAPLPAELIGLDPTCYIRCGSTRVEIGDRLALLASSKLAPSLWSHEEEADFSAVANRVIQEAPDAPFWLGLVDID